MKTAAIAIASATLLLSQASAFSVVGGQTRNSHAASVTTTTQLNMDPSALSNEMIGGIAVGATAIAGLVGFAASQGGGQKSTTKDAPIIEEEEEVIDVSIPYDSAARLAFDATGLDEAKFAEFKPLYEAKTIADVTVKKMAREVQSMEAVAAAKTKSLEALLAE